MLKDCDDILCYDPVYCLQLQGVLFLWLIACNNGAVTASITQHISELSTAVSRQA